MFVQKRRDGFGVKDMQLLEKYLKSLNPAQANEFFVGLLQCQNNMKLVFRISEDDSEIELKHCASYKTSVKSSRKYFVHLNWIRLATNPR